MSIERPLLPEDSGFWYPRWREMWEESLDEPSRRRITDAVWRGRSLADPVEARYAVTLAVQKRRLYRWYLVIAAAAIGMALFRLAIAFQTPTAAWSGSDWVLGAIWGFVLLATAPLGYWRYRLITEAEHRNRKVVAGHESDI